MYVLRYVLVFVCELFYSWPLRSHIQCEGYAKGSIGALVDWCRANARFSATHRHPLYYCVRRDRFSDWMGGK